MPDPKIIKYRWRDYLYFSKIIDIYLNDHIALVQDIVYFDIIDKEWNLPHQIYNFEISLDDIDSDLYRNKKVYNCIPTSLRKKIFCTHLKGKGNENE